MLGQTGSENQCSESREARRQPVRYRCRHRKADRDRGWHIESFSLKLSFVAALALYAVCSSFAVLSLRAAGGVLEGH